MCLHITSEHLNYIFYGYVFIFVYIYIYIYIDIYIYMHDFIDRTARRKAESGCKERLYVASDHRPEIQPATGQQGLLTVW